MYSGVIIGKCLFDGEGQNRVAWWSAIGYELSALSFLSLLVTVFIVGEKMGWHGFLLPDLFQHYSPLTSSLIVGPVWAALHVPDFLLPNYAHYGLPLLAFVLMALAFSILFTWLYLNTAGSMLIAVLFHAALNLFSLSGLEPSRQYWLKDCGIHYGNSVCEQCNTQTSEAARRIGVSQLTTH